MMRILRAGERYVTEHDGIRTWHCFSAGAHYDADNVNFGPLVGVDEHVLAPSTGFDEHPHRGVEIISWIADGQLEHSVDGETQQVNAGESLIQDAATGLSHAERNASTEGELRLIQMTLLTGAGVTFDALRAATEVEAAWLHLFVVEGSWTLDDIDLESGDSVRIDGEGPHALTGTGTVLSLRSD